MKRGIVVLSFASCIVASGAQSQNATNPTPLSCAPTEYQKQDYRLDASKDEFESTTSLSSHTPLEVDRNVRLVLMRETGKDSVNVYSLLVGYSADNWMFLEAGESLQFLVDGEKVSLRTIATPSRDVVRRGGIYETAFYRLTPELVYSLASAKTVKMRLVGTKHIHDVDLSREASCGLARFYTEAVSTHHL